MLALFCSRNARKTVSTALMLVMAAVLCRICAPAQSNPNEEQGLRPYDSFHGGDFDSISLTNGGLTGHIPLVSFPQRGKLDLSFLLRFSSKQWQVKQHCTTTTTSGTACTYRWGLSRGDVGAQVISSVDWRAQTTAVNMPDPSGGGGESAVMPAVISPDGTLHQLGGVATGPSGTQPGPLLYPIYSLDATGIYQPDANDIILSSGTRFQYPSTLTTFPQGKQPTTITDTDGNQITISSSGWTDTMGRVIPGSAFAAGYPVQPGIPTSDLSNCPTGTASAMVWNVPGVAGVDAGVRTFELCYSPVAFATNFQQQNVAESSGTFTLLTAIVLPDSTMWTLSYDNYGNVTKIGFPTGGSISYGYTTSAAVSCNDPLQIDYTAVSRWVTSRTVDANDGAGAHTWNYSYVSGSTTVTDPNGNDTVHTITVPVQNSCSLYDTQVKSYQGSSASGTLLRTVTTQYTGTTLFYLGAAVNVVPTQGTTSVPSGQTSKVVYSYDTGGTDANNNPYIVGSLLQKDEYDYSNTLVRTTLNNYVWQNNANYKSNNLLSLLASTTIKDGFGNQVAQTAYYYDESAVVSSGITTGHVASPSGNIRGHLTSVSRWLNTNNSFISSTSTYFDTGTPASSTDPLGNTTGYSYSSTFAGAYLTRTNLPDTQMPDVGAPVVHHVISGNYDFNTGLLTSFTDENGQQYGYQYDRMLRLIQGNHPDGGYTTFSYPDSLTVQRQRLISGNTLDSFTVKFDGIGRAVQSQQVTPSGTVLTDTTYDAVGHASAVSNPYYQGSTHSSDPTYGVTTTQYDALGRSLKTIKQDGSFSTVQYNTTAADGAADSSVVCATTTDEAGKQRQVCNDALGRLVKVFEPGDSYAGTIATGSFTISGTLQSVTTGGQAATVATGNVTINPASGTDRSVQVQTQAAAGGRGSVTIGGQENSTTVDPCADSGGSCPRRIFDLGSVSITVNGHTNSVNYNSASTASNLASNLVSAINNDSAASVTASISGTTVNLTAKTMGTSTNYQLSATSTSSDPGDFTPPSFGISVSGATLTGGVNAVNSTFYDTGAISITVNGHSDQSSFGQNDTANTIAARLATAINGDNAAPVTASASGNVVNLASKIQGTAGNVSLVSSFTYDTAHFSGAFFTTSNSSTSLTGGVNGVNPVTVYDAGTLTATLAGFTTSVAYGQPGNSSAAQVASALAAAFNTGNSPVTATASGGTVSVLYKAVGVAGNTTVSMTSTTSQTQYFASPSFSGSGTTLAGGIDSYSSSLTHPYLTTYQYNARNELLCVHQKATDSAADKSCTDSTVPAPWRPRVFTYDSLSRLLTAQNPESGAINYAYDNGGHLISKTSPAPNQTSTATVTVTYAYDHLGRLTDKSYSDGATPTASFRYDYATYQGQTLENTVGRLMAAIAGNGSGYLTSYDVMGRVAQTTECIPGVAQCQNFSANYDQLGDVQTLGYPGAGFTVTYGYDSAARLISATDSNGVIYAQNPTILASGAMQEFISPNFSNNKFHADFNNRLQPTEIWTGSAQGASALFDKQYSYNAPNTSQMNNGNVYTVTNVKDDSRTQVFTYDALNRLISAGDKAHWSNTYVYDAWGNLCQKNPGAPAGENLVTTADTNNRLSGISYDAAGNVTNDGTGNTFVYDAENRIISVTNGGVTTNYTYDAAGQRIKKSSGSSATNYWYGNGGETLAETDASGNFTNYIYFAGQRLARNIPQPSPAPADIKYYITDHLHSTAVFADRSGTVLDDNDFYPWGGIVSSVGTASSNNHYKFSGKERDTESGLDYFGARYYANTTGRFMSPDWAANPASVPYAEFSDPQSLNLYSYVRNSPVVRIDADGHSPAILDTPSLDPGHGSQGDPGGPEDDRYDVTTKIDEDGNVTQQIQKVGSSAILYDGSAFVPTSLNPASQQTAYDSSRTGPADPTNPSQPLFRNQIVQKASDEAFIKTRDGTARDGLAEAGFAIEYKDGKISIDHKVDSVFSDKKPNDLRIQTDGNTIAILHTHGNKARPTPSLPTKDSPGDVGSKFPNFVRSSNALYVTVPGTTSYIQLLPAPK